MAQDKRQENQPETPMETQPELQPVDALRDSRRRLTRSIVVTVVLAAVAALAVFEGITLGWLSNPNRNVDANETDIQSASVTEQDGHDTYKFDVNLDKGVCINDDAAVTMNAYDKELPKRNERTPIILRAVLSSSHSTSQKLSLKITCASKELKQETLTEVTAAQYNGQLSKTNWAAGDKINWLSNVVNVRAGYIPGLQTRAVAGDYEPYTAGDYKDADDYIYNYAVDFFRASTAITPVKFVTLGSSTTPEPTSVSSQRSRSISVNQIGTLPERAPETNSDGSTKTYTYKIDYYTISNGGNVLNQNNTDHVEFEEAPGGYKLKYGDKYLSYNATYSTGWWHELQSVTLITTDSADDAAIWTVTGDAGNIRISCKVDRYSDISGYYQLNYLSFSGNVWSLSQNQMNLTITQHCTETVTTTFPEISVGDEKNLIINVDLAGAKDPDDGRYYVYLMFDYDHELVNKYLTDNGISLKLGSENIQFTDAFQIEVVATPTT